MVKTVSQEEFFAILQFLVLSAIIIPLLPSELYDPFGFFDWRPQTIWLMVVLVAAIRFIGYFVAKFMGKEKSLLLSGVIGGFVSSTAVTTSVAQDSNGKKGVIIFLVPILIANVIMFARVITEVTIVAGSYINFLIQIAIPLIAGGSFLIIIALYFWWQLKKASQTKQELKKELKVDQPLDIKSAISFGLFFLFVLLVAEKIPQLFPDTGLYLAGIIAGLSDVDAITLAMSNLVANGEVAIDQAAGVVLLAVATNTLVKVGIVFTFGNRKLFRYILATILCAFSVGAGTFFLM